MQKPSVLVAVVENGARTGSLAWNPGGMMTTVKPFTAFVVSNPTLRSSGETAEQAIGVLQAVLTAQILGSDSIFRGFHEIHFDELIVQAVLDS